MSFRRVALLEVATLAAACLALQCSSSTTEVVCLTDLESTDAGRKVQAFIETSNALIRAAGEIDADMLNTCRRIAGDLGIPSADLAPALADEDKPGAAAMAACTRVAREIDTIVAASLATNARLAVVYTPAVCTVDADARLRCEQQCDPVTVTVTRLECKPGRFYGQCMASCMGTCTGTCMGGCMGSCTATCTGTCTGRCNGTCAGTCAARNASGTCYGACDGTCTGTCDGTCSGSCNGSCHGSCAASCMGSCEGSCTAWVSPPECIEVQETTTVPECKTNCDARARFEASCTEPSLEVTYGYEATAAQRMALDRLVVALSNNYARLLVSGYRAAVVIHDAAVGYATALDGVSATAKQVGLGAAACVTEAVVRVGSAISKIDVSISVSVSVTASVSAMGGLPPPM